MTQGFQPITPVAESIFPIVTTLGAAETDIVTAVKPGWYQYIESITIANISGNARTFTLYLKPTGVAGAAGNSVCAGVTLNANTIYNLPIGPLILPTGYEFTGLASAGSAINVTVSGRILLEAPEETRL